MQKRTGFNSKRIFILIIAMALLATSLPLAAFAAPLDEIYEEGSFDFYPETVTEPDSVEEIETPETIELPETEAIPEEVVEADSQQLHQAVDIAPQALTVVASNELSTHPARQAVNGNLTTRWATDIATLPSQALPLTLELGFDGARTVYYAGLSSFDNGAVRVQEFSIDYWTETGWQEAYRSSDPLHGGNPAPAPRYFLFDVPVTSDRFRLAIHAFDLPPTIWAFQLFDAPSAMSVITLENARVNRSPIGANQTLAFLEATAVRMAEPGARLTVTAAPPPAGYVFDRWETEGLLVGVHATELHMRQARFPFTMPDGNVSIRPVYRPHNYDIRVGLSADIHLGQTRAELGFPLNHRFTSVADWFTTQGLDAIGISGDITRTSGSGNTSGVQADFNTLRNISQGRFDTPRYPTEGAPQLMVSLGNHCSPGQGSRGLYNSLGFGSSRAVRLGGDAPGEGYWFLTINAGNTQAGEAAFMDDHVRGFHMGGNSSGQTYTCPQMRAWMRRYVDQAAADGEPIFLFVHHAIQNTVYVSHEWNTTNFGSNINNWYFRNDPHVVIFSGHTHAPNNDPRSIWQMPGGFTVVNLMSTEFLEMENRGTRNQQYIGNNVAGTGTSTRPRHRYNASGNNTHVGASTMEISGTTVTIRNFDFSMEGGLNDSVYEYYNQVWTFDVMDFNDRPFTNARAGQAQAPIWAAIENGNEPYISVRDIGYTNVTVEFEQPIMPAYNPVNETVHSYRFVFRNLDTGAIDRTAWQWSDFMYPTRQRDTFTQQIGGLRRATNYRLEIHAYGSFQRESEQYLTIDFRTDGEAEPARTYSLSFDGHLSNEDGRTPEAVQTVSNLAGNVVQPRFEPGSQEGRQAIRLDRENFINLGAEPDVFDYNNSFTIAYRINVLERTGNFGIILGNKNYASGGNNGFVFLVRNGQAPNGYILLNTTSGGNRLNGATDVRIAYAHVGDNDIWIHIAVVYCFETNTVSYYADGERVGRRNHNLQAGMNGQRNTMIGQVTNGTALYANASNNSTFLMEDFLLTPGALTSEEIYALANSETVVEPAIVNVGAQVGTVAEGEARTVSFDVQKRNIPTNAPIALNGAPTGISLLTTATAGDITTVEIAVAASVPGDRHPVSLTIGDITSETFYITVATDFDWDGGFALPFDGDLRNLANNPLELSVRNRAGTQQTPSFVQGSRPGRQAIHLNGENFIDLGLNPVDYSEDFSIAFRVNAISQQGADNTWAPAIVSNKNWNAGGNPGWAVAVRGNADTNRRIRLNNTSIGTGGNRQDWYVGTANDLLIGNNDNWMHVAFAFDFNGGPNGTGSITTYVNGQQFSVLNQNFASGMTTNLNTLLGNAHANAANGSFYNGGNPGGSARNMNMHIEDFVLIPGLLTADEVARLDREGLAETTDFTALTTLITYAEGLDAADFTAASWATLAPAITTAEAVRDNPSATQIEVDAAVVALQSVIDALEAAGGSGDILWGDTNMDGDVDAMDVLWLQRYLMGHYGLPGFEFCRRAADVNDDGTIDTLDVFHLQRYLAGQPVILGPQPGSTLGLMEKASIIPLSNLVELSASTPLTGQVGSNVTVTVSLDTNDLTHGISVIQGLALNFDATVLEVVSVTGNYFAGITVIPSGTSPQSLPVMFPLGSPKMDTGILATIVFEVIAEPASGNNTTVTLTSGNVTEFDASWNMFTHTPGITQGGSITIQPAGGTPIDKTLLEAAIIAAGLRGPASNYTTASWNAFQTALTAAEGVMANASATQAQVNTALVDLNATMTGLALISSLTGAVRTSVNSVRTGNYVYVTISLTENVNEGLLALVQSLQYDASRLSVVSITPASSAPMALPALPPLTANPLLLNFFSHTTLVPETETGALVTIRFEILPGATGDAVFTLINNNAIGAGFTPVPDAQMPPADDTANTSSVNIPSDTPTHSVTLSTTVYTFPAATVGYGVQAPFTVTVTNTGNQATGNLTVVAGTGFTVTPTNIPSIGVGGTATFTVVPNTGLAVGTHTATVTVDSANIIAVSLTVSFTVNNTGSGGTPNPPTPEDYEVHLAYMFGNGGNFRPRADITRAEAATILARTQLLDFEQGVRVLPPDMTSFNTFSDVTQGDWFFYYVAWAYDAGLIQGYGGRFRPNDPITREELAAILARTTTLRTGQTSFSDASNISNWAQGYVYTVYRAGWMMGDDQGTFRPVDNITRAEVATAMNRILGRLDSRAAFYVADVENLYRASTFPDVAATAWYFPSVLAAANDHHLRRTNDGAVSWKYIVR